VNVRLVSGLIGLLGVPVIEIVAAGERGKFAPMRKKSRKSDKLWLCCFDLPILLVNGLMGTPSEKGGSADTKLDVLGSL
jgi:hypothetical protein